MRWGLITGASRGFGRALALEFARQARPARLFLTGRDVRGLEGTRDLVAEEAAGTGPTVTLLPADLSDLGAVETLWDTIAAEVSSLEGAAGSVFHNAGSLDPLGTLGSLGPRAASALDSAVRLNVTHVALLTDRFLRWVDRQPRGVADAHWLVNVSSLAARSSFPSWGVYGATKAFRDSLMQTAALESSHRPIRVRGREWVWGQLVSQTREKREGKRGKGWERGEYERVQKEDEEKEEEE